MILRWRGWLIAVVAIFVMGFSTFANVPVTGAEGENDRIATVEGVADVGDIGVFTENVVTNITNLQSDNRFDTGYTFKRTNRLRPNNTATNVRFNAALTKPPLVVFRY
jgi:hypothetical protein